MRDIEKKKVQNTSTNNQAKRAVKTARKDNKPLQEKGRKPSNAKETPSKGSQAKPASNSVASDTNVSTESSEVYENMVIHYVDDAYRSGVSNQVPNGHENAIQEKEDGLVDDHSSEFGNDTQKVKGEDSDFESAKDSSSSQGDSRTADDEKLESRPKKSPKKASSEKKKSDSKPKKEVKSHNPKVVAKNPSDNNNKCMDMKVHPSSAPSEGTEDEPIEEPSQEMFDAASNGAKSTESDTETVQTEENDAQQEKAALKEKVEMMESRIEKLEEELREVAALEISLYSVIPEHGSSAHKVHTPARRLSRLYIHACKHWKPSKRATIAQNTVSGLILVARTCGNDVARLTFWLSNTVVLRGIISQAFGISSQLKNGAFSKLKGVKQVNKTPQLFEDWQEKSTFTAALEKIESWIFSRVVESVWWQALTPNMLSPVEDLINQKSIGRLLGPALGDQKQGTFSIELWKNAFQTAFERLCPVRAAGHECGCLPALARMVMEQCVSRLDVAMFNAILRESAHQIPTDPVSDPIVDSRVLPIPAGELSFGSGAQLKNAVGNWSTWFADSLGLENGHPSKDHHLVIEVDDNETTHAKTDCFQLLNELSDLLMLPKDMLMDRSIRKEVCPSIILPVMIRILCNFTPDEFCPDAVPGEVLEALNAENFVERRVAGESSGSFPYAAAVVAYSSPSSEDISEKVAEAGGKSQLERNASMVQKKGYTSDEELDDLDSPLSSLIEPSSPSTSVNGKGSLVFKGQTGCRGNARYELLREVWSS